MGGVVGTLDCNAFSHEISLFVSISFISYASTLHVCYVCNVIGGFSLIDFFVYAAPTLWNALDLDIRLLPFDTFKKSVNTHLYLKYFVN